MNVDLGCCVAGNAAIKRGRHKILVPRPFLQHIDPWNVQGGADGKIDYNKLVEQVRTVCKHPSLHEPTTHHHLACPLLPTLCMYCHPSTAARWQANRLPSLPAHSSVATSSQRTSLPGIAH